MNWFEVDKGGLAKLFERRGKAFVVTEPIQNAWDTNAKHVDVKLVPVPGKPRVLIEVVDDDPDGFANMAHAFTLFAESAKKGDATKRGRFNLGEKLVLALCDEATITSTRGSVHFSAEGRQESRRKRDQGSSFAGTMRMTREEFAEVLAVVSTLIPPEGVETFINGEPLRARAPLATIEATLPTEIADEEGVLRRRERRTTLRVYEPLSGETASVYELGIPVVETGDRYHVDVGQKVPLSLERDNLPPAYLRSLRVLVLNAMAGRVEDANAAWVREALGDERASDDAVKRIMDIR